MLAFLALLSLVSVSVSQDVQVDTVHGPVVGHTNIGVNNGQWTTDIVSFLGVPYGKSTEHHNRFRKPEIPDPWTEPIICDSFGDQCPQGSSTDGTSEDCLNVNVYVPTDGTGPYPVMVWFHGGAYTGGSNQIYPGHFLASHGVVVVGVNYRLNHFGFAYTATADCPGNAGLWDQHLSLEWVRDNIANFQGDPGRVTIFGQSAGASSSSLHLLSPHSAGLFHGAIMISGAETNFWGLNYPEASPENFIWEVAEKLNCSNAEQSADTMLDCLREWPWPLVRMTSFDCTPGHFCQGMGPVIDGPGGFIPEHPKDLRNSPSIPSIPIITGHLEHDGSFYTAGMIPEALFGGFNRSEFQRLLRERLVGIWGPGFDNTTEENVYRALDFNYTPWPYTEDEYNNRQAFNEMITDLAFGMPWDRQLRDHCAISNDVYGYVFNYRGRNSSQLVPEWLAVPHAGDLPYIWGWALIPLSSEAVRNDTGWLLDIIDWTQEDYDYAFFWETLLTNFAKTGNPTPEPVLNPLGEYTEWSTFCDDMSFIHVYNETIQMLKEWRQQDYAFFREYLAYITRDYAMPLNSKDTSGRPSKIYDSSIPPLHSSWMDEFTQALEEMMWEERMEQLGMAD